MLAFTHDYSSTITAVRHLESCDEVAALVGGARDELISSQEYRSASWREQNKLMKDLVGRYTSFTFGRRLLKDAVLWLSQAEEAGDVYTFQSGGYPSRYFIRGKHVLPQLQVEVMTRLEDWLRPAQLPEPDDWVYIEEWDQS